jgi:hypothetical protein
VKWNSTWYLFTIKWLRICSKMQFLNNYDGQWNETRHTCSLSNGEPITTRQDGVVFSCQQIEVNTFYKCIEFQVNSFDSYWEILIILKKYPKFLCTMSKQLSNGLEFLQKCNFSIIMMGSEMKLDIPVHYQMGNPL